MPLCGQLSAARSGRTLLAGGGSSGAAGALPSPGTEASKGAAPGGYSQTVVPVPVMT
jgi:hypothetical protein